MAQRQLTRAGVQQAEALAWLLSVGGDRGAASKKIHPLPLQIRNAEIRNEKPWMSPSLPKEGPPPLKKL